MTAPNPESTRALTPAERAELVKAYREAWPAMGVWALRCAVNGKLLIGASMNLAGAANQVRFRLKIGSFPSDALAADVRAFGADAFAFEVLDTLDPPSDDARPRALVEAELKEELAALEAMWQADLQPWGDRGYGRVPAGAGAPRNRQTEQ